VAVLALLPAELPELHPAHKPAVSTAAMVAAKSLFFINRPSLSFNDYIISDGHKKQKTGEFLFILINSPFFGTRYLIL